ncbi:intracellular growth attenuator family protein [Flavobacterium sp. NRK1]|uniref:intracellular growth attenuator family protein n=1 Tax=Flavobacterium sp. NRK1 TaxID=2954929 RepID=UPI0020925392|nr:intracellular growth attenuator family protein [Flavobacterium sp. NRK1]MCO6146466.1 intracellular growth attenuator family protein [Flavobacterium sp. NRK1]
MKPLYYLLLLIALFVFGYLIINDFNFDNITFSDYLINTLFFLLLSCLVVAIVGFFVSRKRRHLTKDVMTIRQYYEYKSAR